MQSSLAVALLVATTSAHRVGYRPTPGSVPWGGAASRPEWDTPPYPVNYYIPNFGVDHNILTTLNSLKIAEKGAKKELKAAFAQSDAPADLRVPNLGPDEDIKNSLAAITESQKESGKQVLAQEFPQRAVQYAQSMGQETEIADSLESLNLAEKKINHTLATERLPSAVAYNQPWQQLGQDNEIALAQANIAESEKLYGKFVPVKDFQGLWRIGKEEQNAVQLEADIQILSDPICSSAGCGQYKHPDSKEVSYPMDYGVPSFGMDRDIANGIDNLGVAEGIVGHHWVGIDAAKFANPAKKVMYNFAPKLDGDIIDSRANLAATEKVLEHTYELA